MGVEVGRGRTDFVLKRMLSVVCICFVFKQVAMEFADL